MIRFKKLEDSDQDFNEWLYHTTREKELSTTNWPEDQKQRFTRMQLMAQMTEYRNKYQDGIFDIILFKKKPAGRLFLAEWSDEIRLIDICLLPEFKGKGIGKEIISNLVESARKNKKKISLYVLHDNIPAKTLYESKGFKKLRVENLYEYMEWEIG